MYLPKAFEETDREALHALIRRHPLATFVIADVNGLSANHLPMLIEAQGDGLFVLRGHVARANPLWRALVSSTDALAIFQDAGLYVTPSWYPSKRATGRVVPTWNYVAVHVKGSARAIDDPEWLRAFLTRLTATHEHSRAEPWHVTDAPADHIDQQLRAIVGIEMSMAAIEGKWKVSQNRTAEDAAGVVEGLKQRGDPDALRMAELIASRRSNR